MSGKSFDVVICGFGPTGAVAANLLGQLGVSVLVVEREQEIIGFPRAVHFDGEVMRIFQSLGLAGPVGEITHPAAGVRYINGRGATLIDTDFTTGRTRHGWARGHYFSQPQLEAVIRANLSRFDSVRTRLGWEVTGFEQAQDSVEVSIAEMSGGATETVSARYLLACDGASSRVRKQLGCRMRQLGPSSTWLVCDTELEGGIPGDRPMYQVCDSRRPVTVEPCSGKVARWEFRVLPDDPPQQLEHDGFALSLMRPYLQLVDPALDESGVRVQRSKVYTFRSAVAPVWRSGRVFLLGDAAHLTPPFLGQGMCAGIRDARNLCWKLAGVLSGRYGEELLDSYESERKPHVTGTIRDATGIAAAIQAANPVAAWLRDRYLQLRSRVPWLSRPMAREASWSLGPGLFDDDGARTPACDRHNLFDQPVVQTAGGNAVRLDDLLGPHFALLFFGPDPAAVLSAEQVGRWEQLGARCWHVLPAGQAGVTDRTVVETDDTLGHWRARVGGVDVAVVRPDRQVFGRYRGNYEELARQLERARDRLDAGLGLCRANP